MAHTMEDFTLGVQKLLIALESTLFFKNYINKMSGNKGRAAELRQVSLDIDTTACVNIRKINSLLAKLNEQHKVAYYFQAVKYIEKMHALESLATEKLNGLIKEHNFTTDNMPEFLTNALNTHQRLVDMGLGLKAMVAYLETNKPEITFTAEETKIQILDTKRDKERERLIHRL